MSDNNSVPAGWYPDSSQPGLQRYWDGVAWTTHTAPLHPGGAPAPVATAATAGPALSLTKPAAASPAAPIPPATTPAAPSTSTPAPSGPPAPYQNAAAPAPKSSSKAKWWLIGAGAAVALLVVGIAVGANGRSTVSPAPDAVAAASTPVASPTPTITPTPAPAAEAVAPVTEPAPVEAPVVEAPVVDAAGFTASANTQLDDVNKDLNDMIVTLDEDGFWRLLSNYGELSFNLGQLQALTPTPNVAAEWNAQLVALEANFDVIGDAISTDQNAAVRPAVEAAASQSAILREVASRAAQ